MPHLFYKSHQESKDFATTTLGDAESVRQRIDRVTIESVKRPVSMAVSLDLPMAHFLAVTSEEFQRQLAHAKEQMSPKCKELIRDHEFVMREMKKRAEGKPNFAGATVGIKEFLNENSAEFKFRKSKA